MNGLILKQAVPVTIAERFRAQQAKEQVLRNAIGAAFAGLGVGASARGLQGLLNLWNRTVGAPATARKPTIVDIPVPEEDEGRQKIAEDPGWTEWLQHPFENMGQMMSGSRAETARQVPFNWIPVLALGSAGAYGGWKGLDYLLDRAREQELASQEERARQEYEKALASQSKLGEALGDALDSLYDQLTEAQRGEIEKTANIKDYWGDATNLYGLYALLSGLLGAHWAYNRTRSMQPSIQLEKARRKYMRTREGQRPTPVFVRTDPISQGGSMRSAPSGEELEGSPLDKAAGCGLIMAYAR